MTSLIRTVATCIVPLLLLGVAGFQIYSAHSVAQSPWKGGGFGMFSTVDAPTSRIVRAFLIVGDAEIAVELPADISRIIGRVQTRPSLARIEDLAQRLSKKRWFAAEVSPREGQNRARSHEWGQKPGSEDEIQVGSIRVELWRCRFVGDTRTVVFEKFIEATVPAVRK